ncbi:hypothetical protein [Sinorhizobium chiapasense]|uniref:Uncharacterized protein n=1 Tax=Sinorhizobium chiapasense TaxID=501572 RepID=A0ABZ2BJV4_9HYPH
MLQHFEWLHLLSLNRLRFKETCSGRGQAEKRQQWQKPPANEHFYSARAAFMTRKGRCNTLSCGKRAAGDRQAGFPSPHWAGNEDVCAHCNSRRQSRGSLPSSSSFPSAFPHCRHFSMPAMAIKDVLPPRVLAT